MSGAEPAPDPAAGLREERRGRVAILTLDRPESRNAIDAALARALGDALARLDADPDVRAIVLAGAGKGFSAGMDLREFAAGATLADVAPDGRGFAGIAEHRLETPTIAAVHGLALGGGAEIALACDLIVLERDAQLGFPEVLVGLFPAGGGALRLPQQMPPRIALEVLMTGRRIDAAEADRRGLVNRVVEPGGALDAAVELAQAVAAAAPLGVRAARRLAHLAASTSSWSAEASAASAREGDAVFASDDAREGVAAFLDRRAPEWSGA